MHGLASDGIRYQGFLYFGLMLTESGPRVLEFNCRLGDPETQAIVARMDFDLAEILADVAGGHLDPSKLRWTPGASVCVVLASGGYPGKFAVGQPIIGLTDTGRQTGVEIFHAGTKRISNVIETSGGRVLGVTAARPSLGEATVAAYQAVGRIQFDGMHYRKDIASQTRCVRAVGD
jgi:phosphoribosylamine---glycine ligase